MTVLSRRSLVAAAGSGLVLSAASVVGADPAEAKIKHSATTRRYGSVGILGDSASGGFLNGLDTSLVSADVGPYRYDIRGSRRITKSWLSYDSGVSAAKKMIASGFRPRAWVVGLGSNDFYFFRRNMLSPRTEIETFLDVVGDARVAWLTIWTKRAGAYHATFNRVLTEVAASRANLHVVDWASVAKRHPEWLQADGAHLKMPGAKARNEYLAKAAVVACKAAGAVNAAGAASGGTSSATASTTPAVGRVTLARGARGPAVEELQRLLTAAGFPVRVDGDFGAATARALAGFQRAAGLRVDGVVGPVTWRALDRGRRRSASQPRPTLQRGSRGPAVEELQRLLGAHGFRLRVDGEFGAATERKVKGFQRARRLRPDGVVGPVTWRALSA